MMIFETLRNSWSSLSEEVTTHGTSADSAGLNHGNDNASFQVFTTLLASARSAMNRLESSRALSLPHMNHNPLILLTEKNKIAKSSIVGIGKPQSFV